MGTRVDELADYAIDIGFDTFIFWPRNEPLSQLKRFADEVVPRVRERIAERRRGA